MTDIVGLIEQMEKATGPDRELDAAIWAAAIVKIENSDPYIFSRFAREDAASVLDDVWGEIWRDDIGMLPPRYTASIDAAVTLVPEDWWWSCGHCKREEHASVGREVATSRDDEAIDGFGATVAIALCIAALKARFHKEG